MIWRCDLTKQYDVYKNEIHSVIKKVLASGHYILGEEVNKFEKEFADYIGVKYAIGVASGTDALILSLKVLGIKQGDEVITTPFTAIPTISAIIAAGAIPVFVDVDPNTFLIDIGKVPDAVNSKTKAIIPVHLFGNMVDINKLKSITKNKIPIIEDACQAHGSRINNKLAGSMGLLGCFSFYPTKNLGGYGDGGAITTNNTELAEKLKLLRMYGMANKDEIIINGINSRLDEIQAAILRVKLKYLDKMNLERNKIANIYKYRLNNNFIEHQKVNSKVFSNYHVFVSKIKNDRNDLIEYLALKKIQTNIYYPIPVHLQKANKFLGYKKGDFPNAERICKEVIALPMYAEMKMGHLTKVINTIINCIK